MIGQIRPGAGKAALAAAPSRPLPDEIVARAKTGFGVPTGAWAETSASAVTQFGNSKGLTSRRWSQLASGRRPVGATGPVSRALDRRANRATVGAACTSRLMQRVLRWSTDAFGGSGGIAQYNRDFLGALADSGLVSSIVGPAAACAETRVALPTGDQPGGSAPRPHRLRSVGAARRARPTGRHGLLRPSCIWRRWPVLIARWHRAKLIVQMHGIEAWPRPSRLQRRAVEAADLVLCVSRYTRARVIEWAAIAPERVVVLPNTVGEAFTPGDGSALRAAWGLAGQARAADRRPHGCARTLQGPRPGDRGAAAASWPQVMTLSMSWSAMATTVPG